MSIIIRKIDIYFFAVSIIFAFLVNPVNASVSYDSGNNQIIVSGETAIRDLPWLYNQLNTQYPALKDKILRNSSSKIWYLTASLCLDNSAMSIDGSTVSELRMSNTNYGGCQDDAGGLYGDFRITNTAVHSWNTAANRYADAYNNREKQEQIHLIGGELNNVDLSYINRLMAENLRRDSNKVTIKYIDGAGGDGIQIINADKVTISNWDAEYLYSRGFACGGCTNTSFKNITLIHSGEKNAGSYGGGFGFAFAGGHHNSAENVYVDVTSWGGVQLDSGGPYNIVMRNITIKNAGHNSLDLHGAGHNLYFEDIYMSNPSSGNNNLWIITNDDTLARDMYNVTFKNIYTSGGGAGIQLGTSNKEIYNITFDGFNQMETIGLSFVLILIQTV